MAITDKSFGFLTMATHNDYLKAIGLALSLRVSNPGIPIAIACSNKIRALVEPYFDYVIEEKVGLRGFVHKVYLDEYSPFYETVFFDSDILVFKPVLPYVRSWGDASYYACGKYVKGGKSTFGLETAKVLELTGKSKMVDISGAGHAFFRMPEAKQVFDMAREITSEYKNLVGDIPYADEDVVNIVMTKLDMSPAPYTDFFARTIGAKFGTLKMDAVNAQCSYIYTEDNELKRPCMIHFAANEAPVVYTWQIYKLFKHFNVPTKGLLSVCVSDFYERYIKLKLNHYKRKVFGILGIGT